MKEYLKNYRTRIAQSGNTALSEAIQKTVDDVVPKYISTFSYRDHVVGLLVGDVQSGKTSHMFGLMTAAADEGFGIFVLLTTDNILLQQQTFKRAERDLCDFCVCDENDYLKFCANNMKKPAVIVLKKNGRILRQWKNNFASTQFVAGNPLFIVDDEADAASLNTQVNKNKQSTINKCLDEIKRTTSSSVYLQVTGTPQSILLQSIKSGWKPYFIYYFRPGNGYMGGNFFFEDPEMKHIVLTDNTESRELLDDDEFPENGLKTALIMHLISAAHIMINGGKVCNFLIHPSFKTSEHSKFAEKIGNYLNELVSLRIVVKLLEEIGSECDDWNAKAFIGFVNTFIADNPLAQGTLIVRRNRDIAKGTGTMLSPNDRALGDTYKDTVVLTMYKVTGNKGWEGQQIWMPNIKLPGDVTYYSGDFLTN